MTNPQDRTILIPEIEAAFRRAIRPRERRLTGPFARRGAIILTLGALAIGGTAAATNWWSPVLGDDDRGHPNPSAQTSTPAATAQLGVFRRPQTDQDRSERTRELLRLLPASAFDGIQTSTVRLLDDAPTGTSVLFVADHAPGVPTRSNAICLLQSGVEVTSEGVTATRNGTRPSGGSTCSSPDGVSGGQLMSGFQSGLRVSLTVVAPDGVSQIRLPVSGGPDLVATVRDNFARIDGQAPPGTFSLQRVQWLDSDGNQIARVPMKQRNKKISPE